MHICVSNLTITGSDNGLSPDRRQAIIWTNDGLVLIEHLGTNLNEILIRIETSSFKKMHFKVSSGKWRPFCLSFNVSNVSSKSDICSTFTAVLLQTIFCYTVYPKKYAHGFCFAVLCCGYTLTDFPISTRLTSLALWQSNDCPSASKATLVNMDKYFMWIHYERLHNHNKAKHNKTVCIFLGMYCIRLCNNNTMLYLKVIP